MTPESRKRREFTAEERIKGGIIGGSARVAKGSAVLSLEHRQRIARAAARGRWGDPASAEELRQRKLEAQRRWRDKNKTKKTVDSQSDLAT